MRYKYKFSVVIPIYNVEKYLEETIESVINQSIGFEKNIQIVLVNDGSPDNSEKICLKYRNIYPKNIIYIKQKNAGVSSARNNGLKYTEGKYINFLDSDDKWALDVFEKVNEMFETNNDIDIVACRIKLFEAQNGFNHPLNYKFTNDRIIELKKEPNMLQMHVASCFIRKKTLKNNPFNINLKYAEDSLLVNEIILNKLKYGVLRNGIYMYRKRYSQDSALDKGHYNLSYYNDTLTGFHDNLLNFCIKQYNHVIPYVQYVCMYDLQWRLKKTVNKTILDEKNIIEYKEHIKKILRNIEDDVILESRNINAEYKLYALSLKYNKDVRDELKLFDGSLYYKNAKIYSFSAPTLLKINVINIGLQNIQIAGQINCPMNLTKNKVYIEINDKKEELKIEKSPFSKTQSIDGFLYSNQLFNYTFNYEKNTSIRFYIKYDKELIKLSPTFTKNSKLFEQMNLYYKKNNLVCFYDNKSIIINNNTITLKKEMLNIFYLLKKKKIKALIIRTTAKVLKRLKKREVWLFSDRSNAANDNGMHLFKYVNTQNNKNIKSYFCIDKKSEDFNIMKKYGKVLSLNGIKYKILFLLSDKVISSQADEWVTNPFGKSEKYYRDLMLYDFIFLQHGITQNDISGWINLFNKNIRLLVTSAKSEYDSIIKYPYYYTNSVVKLTGMPRYDNLYDSPKKIIAIMPTWRKNLSGVVDKNTGTRLYNPNFKKSTYFNYYNNLINDNRLLNVMKEKGYKGIFVVHPCLIANQGDFKGNSIFKINSYIADYQEIFKNARLVVSDYSSIQFDFAYLNKPVIYSQFDKADFFINHTLNKGYYSYEKNGFGPVLNNYDDTVNEIIKYIVNDCKLENKYKKRIDYFYAFHDRNNCKRVYEEILKLK